MLQIIKAESTLFTVMALAYDLLPSHDSLNAEQLHTAYIEYLSGLGHTQYQHDATTFSIDNELPDGFDKVENIDFRPQEACFKEHAKLHGAPASRLAKLQGAYAELVKLSDGFKQVFDLIIYQVVTPPDGSWGVSSSNPLYTGYIAVYSDIVADDIGFQEVLLHETVHNALYLDELRYGYYHDFDAVRDKSNYIASGMFGVMLPLERALHSVIVGTEILLARQQFFGHDHACLPHPFSEQIITKANKTIDAIWQKQRCLHLLKPRAVELLEQCAALIN